MSKPVVLPELGENIETADVAAVLVSLGDVVTVDQGLVEVETDKASMEIPSPLGGTVATIHVAVGDTVRVGQELVSLELNAPNEVGAHEETSRSDRQTPDASAQAAASPDAVASDGGAAAAEADSAPVPESTGGEASDVQVPAEPVPAAPSVRRMARDLGVDLRTVEGSGPGGRISADDVRAYVKQRLSGEGRAGTSGMPTTVATPPLPDLAAYGEIERVPMSKVRRLTAEAMSRSWALVPHVTQHDHADVTEVEAFRQQYGRRVEAAGGKLTFTAVALKIVAAALQANPKLNASLDPETDEIVFRKYVHIGVAVDTDRGLLVPVVRDADRKTVTQLAVELADLAARARARQLGPDELQGAGFTVSNLGGLGTTEFTPIVNWPQSAILGLGRAETKAVWRDGVFEPRLILPLSLSYDHRLIDGAEAARFARWVAEAFENPLLMSLGGAP